MQRAEAAAMDLLDDEFVFIPLVLGSLRTFVRLVPVIHAAMDITSAPAHPLVTMPASAPMNSPTLLLRSATFTNDVEAAVMASITSGQGFDPPYLVTAPPVWTAGLMSSCS